MEANIVEVVRTSTYFPRLISQEDNKKLFEHVSLTKMDSVMSKFKKYKSLGPNGWTIEIFLSLFKLNGKDLLHVVVEDDLLYSQFNASILALILNTDKPNKFVDFLPMSLCNIVYNIIAKTLVEHLKLALSKVIYSEQFAFLKGRKIYEAIGATQECLHGLKVRKIIGMIIKLYLSKSFDCIS